MSAGSAGGAGAGPPTVLVVDDNELVLTATSDLLADAGFEVRRATSASGALSILGSPLRPAVLVTDISMPGGADGIALANTVRDNWPEIRVVMISGEKRPEAGEYPQTALFLTKPFPPDALLTIVNDAVGGGDLFR